MTETERILREEFPDPDSQALISLCFGECVRIDREDILRAAEGR